MRALLTGVSSFTGVWFAEALAARGFEIVASCRRQRAAYTGLAAARLRRAARVTRLVERCAFGDERFLDLVEREGPFDLLCLHGAETTGHRRGDFDVDAAVAANTRGVDTAFAALARHGGAVLVTGSIFEADEGLGSEPRGALNAYGLAKTLTWHILRHHAERRGLSLGKLVVPHPFGPLEKPGLTSHMASRWLAGATVLIEQPDLVRDFVHVDLLAAAYGRFACQLVTAGGSRRLAPSGYVESVAAFAERFARALRPRLHRPCRIERAGAPTATGEPAVRHHADTLPELASARSCARSWDLCAAFYREAFEVTSAARVINR